MKNKSKFKIVSVGFAFCGVLLSLVSAASAASPSMQTEGSPFALGLSGVWSFRGATSDTSFTPFAPEIVGYTYHQLGNEGFWLRPGARVSYSWSQPSMPQALRVNDYDFKAGIESGILFNWAIVPSFTLGTGVIVRTTSLVTEAPIVVENDQISGRSLLPYLQAQAGVGLPFNQSKFVIEPFARYTLVFGDSRINWSMGAEASFLLF